MIQFSIKPIEWGVMEYLFANITGICIPYPDVVVPVLPIPQKSMPIA